MAGRLGAPGTAWNRGFPHQDLFLEGGYWTDAYLAAFAAAGGYRLVSFDRDFQKCLGLSLLSL